MTRALNFAVRALGTDPRAEREAEVLKKLGKSIQTTPYSRQWWLREASSFASSRSFGTPVTLDWRTISADISRDEQIHVATNSLVCRELGLNPSNSLNKLRKATVDWVFQPLQANNPDKFLAKNFWHSQSDSLFEKGIAEGFSSTKSARMPAFFEHSNVNLPQYA